MRPRKFYDTDRDKLKVGKIIFYIFGLIVLISVLAWGFKMATRPARTVSEIIERTFDGDNVIYNYEWFKQIVEDLDAAEKRVQITKKSLEDFKQGMPENRTEWGFEDKEQYGRLTTDLRGQEAHLEQMKADLRARSKMANRAIFKGDAKIIRWVDKLAGVQE